MAYPTDERSMPDGGALNSPPPAPPPSDEKGPPFDPNAEAALLGSCLIDLNAYMEVSAFLRRDDFYLHRHRVLWDAISAIYERGESVDELTIESELRAQQTLNDVGGMPYIIQLLTTTPTSANAETYGRLVERGAIRRALIDAASRIAQAAQEETADIHEVMSKAEATLFGVTERSLSRRELVPMSSAISEYYDQIAEQYQHRGEPVGIPTGFEDLDQLLGGMQRSDLIIIAARPGVGKTSLMLSMARNAAKLGNNARVAIFSLEMSGEQLVQRLVSAETGINSQKLRTGDLTDSEWRLFTQAAGNLGALNIFIDDTPALTPLQMRTKCRRLQREHGLDLVIVDYLQLMNSGLPRNDNRVQEISYISRNLKELARELNVPLLSAAQLSRNVEQRGDKRPMLSDLRESGCLAGETRIYLPCEGRFAEIRTLADKSGFHVLSMNPETLKLEPAQVSNAFCTGTKPVFKLTTQLGRTIHATANHKFYTFDGWKRLDELTTGLHIGLPRQLNNTSVQTMTNAELMLLGHLIGDGCTLPRHSIQYTTREHDLAEIVAKLAKDVFGDEIAPRINPEMQWYQVYLSATKHLTHRQYNPIRVWLEKMGIWGLRSYEKYIPQCVFGQSVEAIALFLRHLWATDGCIRIGSIGYPAVYYATSSHQLGLDVQTLLLEMGINARIKAVSQKGKGRDQYHVIVSGADDLRKFVECVGAVGKYKSDSLRQVLEYLDTHTANTNRDVIPSGVWRKYAVPAMQKHKITARRMQADLGIEYCGTGLYKQNIGRERASRLAQVTNAPEIATLALSDLYWDTIASIEPDGETEVYDLTVPGTSNFVANNIVVHNSIEQDADIVMFIYREDMYEENSERQNQADLLISKHRNGPTGVVTLYFNKSNTQFTDMQRHKVSLADY